MGLSEAERQLIHSPVGIGIGARTAPEIALSIMAEIVATIRSRKPDPGVSAADPHVLDPVCGMTVTVSRDTPHLNVDGEDVWFCSLGCRERHALKGER
jgi:xanthine dehydrogenase accessory factor